MKPPISVADAKAQFADVIKQAEHGAPVVLTRYGTPVAVVLSVAEYQDLRRTRAVAVGGGLASLVGGWSGSGELADDLERLQHERRPPRRLPRGA